MILDSNYPWWQVEPYSGPEPHWQLTDAWAVMDSAAAMVYVIAFNSDGTPAFNARCHQLNGGDTLLSFKENPAHQAQADFPMSHDAIFYPDKGQRGPYSVRMDGASDVVSGMGLPVAHHMEFFCVVKYIDGAPTPAPLTPDQAAIQAALKLQWMPINDTAALYRYAQRKNLGYPQTDEFTFNVGATVYVGQVFNLGIVYVKKGDWGNVQWVKKP